MGIQLGVSIGLGVYVGMKLDEHMEWSQPVSYTHLTLPTKA